MPKSNLHFKASSVLRAVKVASKAGLVVSGFEIEPDGAIRVLAAPSGTTTISQTNPWDEVLPDAAHQERTS
jgi:hypothetical protein